MAVYRPKSSPWFHYDFVLKGRRFHGSTGVASRRAAERIEGRLRLDAAEGRLDNGAQLSVDEAALRWWTEVGSRRRHPNKVESRLDRMVAAVGANLKLCEIDQATVAEAMERRRGMTYRRSKAAGAREYLVSDTTVNNDVVDMLRPILRRARTHWRAQGLPEIAWSELRLAEPRETVRVYSEAETRAWLAEAERTGWYHHPDGRRPPTRTKTAADVRLALELILTYGLRFSELFFPLDAFDPAGPRLYWLKGRKRDVPMIVPLTARHGRELAARIGRARAAGLATAWYRETAAGELVAITAAGLEARLSGAADRAGVAAGRRIHGGRHHVGTLFYRATRDLKATQALLGHADVASTLRYVHADESLVRQALERMHGEGDVEGQGDVVVRRNR